MRICFYYWPRVILDFIHFSSHMTRRILGPPGTDAVIRLVGRETRLARLYLFSGLPLRSPFFVIILFRLINLFTNET